MSEQPKLLPASEPKIARYMARGREVVDLLTNEVLCEFATPSRGLYQYVEALNIGDRRRSPLPEGSGNGSAAQVPPPLDQFTQRSLALTTEETEPMTLIERLRNPAWEGAPGGEPARLNIKQTRETMDEAADLIGALVAIIRMAGMRA